jgi:hypothetical protein
MRLSPDDAAAAAMLLLCLDEPGCCGKGVLQQIAALAAANRRR